MVCCSIWSKTMFSKDLHWKWSSKAYFSYFCTHRSRIFLQLAIMVQMSLKFFSEVFKYFSYFRQEQIKKNNKKSYFQRVLCEIALDLKNPLYLAYKSFILLSSKIDLWVSKQSWEPDKLVKKLFFRQKHKIYLLNFL